MKNISVLIADDTTFMRATLQKILSNNGVNTFIEVANGKEAVIKYRNKRPDLVIMDISMPVMAGIKAGARSFLVKPVKEEKLINEIQKIFEKTPVKPHTGESNLAESVMEEITESIEDVQASVDYLKGIEEGYRECRREVATNMLRLGLPIDTVKMCVELSDEEILNYRALFSI